MEADWYNTYLSGHPLPVRVIGGEIKRMIQKA